MMGNLCILYLFWISFLVRKIPWGRAWKPILVFLPGESHGQRRLMGYSLQGHKESDTTELSSVQSLRVQLCEAMDCCMLSFPVHHQLPEATQTHVHQVSDAIQPSHPLPSPSPPAFSPSQNQGLSNESILLFRWTKYWSFSFRIKLSNEYSGLNSFRIDWFELLVVQRTLKCLLPGHSSKVSILWCSAFFMVQVSHQYTTNGKKP